MVSRLRAIAARLFALLRGTSRDDAALADEVAEHLELLEERLRARGLTSEAARREARRAFGGVQQLTEAHRETRAFAWVAQMGQDGRYAARMLRRNPGFALGAVLTLALGIGANTAVFSVINAVILRPLPYPDADRLQRVGWDWNGRGQVTGALSHFKFDYLRQHTRAFDSLATWRASTPDLGSSGTTGTVNLLAVSDKFFDVVGVSPAVGRAFNEKERTAGGPSAALISDAFWHRRYAGAADVLGASLLIDDRPVIVVGVLPARFAFPEVNDEPDVIVPLIARPAPEDLGANFPALGRLARGVAPRAADDDLTRIFEQLRVELPTQFSTSGERAVLMTFSALHLANVQQPLWILFGGVGLLLLIACTNVANLLLARATTRSREMAVRIALGASARRLLRQNLTEGLVLAALGGLAGLALGAMGVPMLVRLAPAGIPRIDEVRIDGAVLAATAIVVLATALTFGAASSLRAWRGHVGAYASILGGRGVAFTRGGRRLRAWLVGIEASLAVVLLAGAVLLTASLARLMRTDLGFDPNGLTVVTFGRMPPVYRSGDRSRAIEVEMRQRLASVPGVTGVASSLVAPLGQRGLNIPMTVDGRPDATEGAVEWRAVSPEYADVVGLRLLRGRWLHPDDYALNPSVTVISVSFAARYWPDQDPLGQRIWLGVFRGEKRTGATNIPQTIVGVVDDIRDLGPTRPPRRTVFVPLVNQGTPAFLVRTRAPLSAEALRSTVREIDPQLPEPTLSTLTERLGHRLARDRFASLLIGLFATVAVLLTAIGVFGVVSWVVRHSTQEIGLRVALGASRQSVLSHVMRRALVPVLVGLTAGGAASFGATSFFATMASVPPDGGVWVPIVAAGLLFAIACAAAWTPARRAVRIDPAAALRAD